MRNVRAAERHSSEGVFALSKRRLKFSKLNMAKFISHLDLMRCFQRAIMRSGLPVEYSQGFNPHQRMTFALPLPVGVTGEGEFADISFEDGKVTDEEIKERLNKNLPPDIQVLSVGDLIFKAADIVCAEYTMKLYSDKKTDKEKIKEFFAKDEVIVMKRNKKKVEKPINIMEYIRAWEIVDETERTLTLRLVLDAGGERNLKPEIVAAQICEGNEDMCADDADICRTKIFCRSGDVLELFR